MAKVKMILAVGPNSIIGKGDKLAWHSKRDLQHFKDLTSLSPCIFGDVTYFGLPVRPLPNRINCVVSFEYGDIVGKKEGHFEARYIEDYIKMFDNYPDIWICGGASIYKYCIRNEKVDEIYLTRVELNEIDVTDPTYVRLPFDLDSELKENWYCENKEQLYTEEGNVKGLIFEKWIRNPQ